MEGKGQLSPERPPADLATLAADADIPTFRREFTSALQGINGAYQGVVEPLIASLNLLVEREIALEARFGPIEAAGPAPSLDNIRSALQEMGVVFTKDLPPPVIPALRDSGTA